MFFPPNLAFLYQNKNRMRFSLGVPSIFGGTQWGLNESLQRRINESSNLRGEKGVLCEKWLITGSHKGERERSSQKPVNTPMRGGRIAWSAPVVQRRGLASKSQWRGWQFWGLQGTKPRGHPLRPFNRAQRLATSKSLHSWGDNTVTLPGTWKEVGREFHLSKVVKGEPSHKKGWRFPKTRSKERSAGIKGGKRKREKSQPCWCPEL